MSDVLYPSCTDPGNTCPALFVGLLPPSLTTLDLRHYYTGCPDCGHVAAFTHAPSDVRWLQLADRRGLRQPSLAHLTFSRNNLSALSCRCVPLSLLFPLAASIATSHSQRACYHFHSLLLAFGYAFDQPLSVGVSSTFTHSPRLRPCL